MATAIVLRETQDATPVGLTGALRDTERTTQAEVLGNVIASSIEAPMPYASFPDSGTRAHVIRPKRGKVLVFESGGETVFARVVHHPGNTARNFFALPMADRWTRALQSVFG